MSKKLVNGNIYKISKENREVFIESVNPEKIKNGDISTKGVSEFHEIKDANGKLCAGYMLPVRIPNESVCPPESLCMIHKEHCTFCGGAGRNGPCIAEVEVDRLYGWSWCKEHEMLGKQCLIEYSIKWDRNVTVKRTSGDIEDNWIINPNKKYHDGMFIPTALSGPSSENPIIAWKGIPIDEFKELNPEVWHENQIRIQHELDELDSEYKR